jgi:glycosyltransferase involved in cell wall biosynthesis
MPSVSEPFGLSALEATQYGVPAVISKQSGVAEVLNGALKADYWDVDLMAKHILDLIEDEKLKTKVVDLGYKDLKKLTWEHTADKLVKVFGEL